MYMCYFFEKGQIYRCLFGCVARVTAEPYKHFPCQTGNIMSKECDNKCHHHPGQDKTHTPYCVVPEKFHTQPVEGQWKFLGGGGSLKLNF